MSNVPGTGPRTVLGLLGAAAIVIAIVVAGVAGTPGSPGDGTADAVLGQPDFTHNAENSAGARGFSASAVAVDSAGHLYVADAMNNRVLGWQNVSALTNGAPADLVIGQPDLFSSSCPSTPSAATLCSPSAVTVDASGNLYVADEGFSRVLQFPAPYQSGTTAGELASIVIGQSSPTASGCNAGGVSASTLCNLLAGLAIDNAGNLFVSDTFNNRVLRFDAPLSNGEAASLVLGQNGRFDTTLCNNGQASTDFDHIGPDSLCFPAGLAIDSAGNLWIADQENNRVLEFDKPVKTDELATNLIGQGDFTSVACNGTTILPDATVLCSPSDVAVDANDNLYVSDKQNNRVLEYDQAATVAGSGDGVADLVFGQRGNFTTSICANGLFTTFTDASTLCQPAAAAVDSAGNLYVADGNSRLLVYNTPLASSSAPGSGDTKADLVLGQTDFNHNMPNFGGPSALNLSVSASSGGAVTVDSQGHLYVADTSNNRVLGWKNAQGFKNGDPATILIGQADFFSWKCNGNETPSAKSFHPPNERTLCLPLAVATDSSGNLYVADSANNRVLQYDTPFRFSGNIGPPAAHRVFGQSSFSASGCPSNQPNAASLCVPTAVAVDASDNLYVMDSGSNRVLEYKTPITTDTVADTVFGQGGSFTKSICSDGSNSTRPPNPAPSADGLCLVGKEGALTGGLALDHAGNLYVADVGNNRVLKFNTPLSKTAVAGSGDTTADLVFGQPDFVSNGCANGFPNPAPSATNLCAPTGLAVDAEGNLFVSDTGNSRVLHYIVQPTRASGSGAGHIVTDIVLGQTSFGARGCNEPTGTGLPTADTLCFPHGLAEDGNDGLFVTDAGNRRLLKYLKPAFVPPTATVTATVVSSPSSSIGPTPPPTPTPPPPPSPSPGGGSIVVSPKTLNFGTVGIGLGFFLRAITIANSSRQQPLEVVVGSLTPPFSTNPGPLGLNHGGRAGLPVLFQPTGVGETTETLTITSSDPIHPQVPVLVKGAGAAGRLKVSFTRYAFPTIAAKGQATKILTLTNVGLGVLNGSVGSFSTSNAFHVLKGGGAFTLLPRGLNRQEVKIAFMPAAPSTRGHPYQDTLGIAIIPPGSGAVEINVSGSAR